MAFSHKMLGYFYEFDFIVCLSSTSSRESATMANSAKQKEAHSQILIISILFLMDTL